MLIVDEPTAGLDPEERLRFRNILARLAGDRTIVVSTHIVEDIAATCRQLAVLRQGRVAYFGDTTGLINTARGKVWTIQTNDPLPPDTSVVSTMTLASTMRYRVLAPTQPHPSAVLTEPGLEDGYLALMQHHDQPSPLSDSTTRLPRKSTPSHPGTTR